ncbi:oxidoreductase [Shewanella sp. 10N.286.52.C2]|uniref:Gfo/Idh/MocA family protein n=1 Tax=Shewanella sp. 10N.286.52.C2 TaxID=1880838 RepID=UPI000C843CB8|nr:Gfo/Idh/MocA family oxidoreductase [Shewanella sp. 10N.286.52.C2]PMG28406.1 oxidoreductase [Shewanella sp. 10N.286.52.C2]
MAKLNWGIVSAGRIAALFCQDLVFSENSHLYAVAARKQTDADEFAKQYQVEKAYQGYQALFDDPKVDIVYIGTPHNFHFQQAFDALTAGKHVLCEKPMTVSTEQCQILVTLAQDKGLLLMEALWTYFLPAMQQAKQWLNDGRIGKLKHIKVDFGYPVPFNPDGREYNAELAGGCLLDMGIYPLAIADYFLQSDIDNLYVQAHVCETGVEDDVIIIGKSDDVMVSLATSFQCRLGNNAYLIGDKGYILIPDAFRAKECHLFHLDDLIESFSDDRQSLGYHFEADEACRLIKLGKAESAVVTHQHSLLFQVQLAKVKALI